MKHSHGRFEFTGTSAVSALWQNYAHLAKEQHFAKGDVFIKPGVLHELYYIKSGQIRMDYCSVDGTEKAVWYLGKNSLAGETPFFLQTPSRTSFVCTKPTVVLAFPRKVVYETILPENPHIVQSLLHGMASKILILTEQIFSSLDPITTRYCKLLYQHSQRQVSGELLSRPPLKKNDIAKLFGIHRITLYKAIRELMQQEVLALAPCGSMRIVDEKKFLFLASVPGMG